MAIRPRLTKNASRVAGQRSDNKAAVRFMRKPRDAGAKTAQRRDAPPQALLQSFQDSFSGRQHPRKRTVSQNPVVENGCGSMQSNQH